MTYTFDEKIVSDLHKDAFGFRPGAIFWNNWINATDDQKQVMWDNLLDALDRAIADKKAADERAIQDFENSIATAIASGAKDRATAIRWIVESLEITDCHKRYDAGYICYRLDLPSSMKKEFEGII